MGADDLRLRRIAAVAQASFPATEIERWLSTIVSFDRPQASLGISRAGQFICNEAHRIGLTDAQIQEFPADGATRWWTFRAPQAWSPQAGRLAIGGSGGGLSYSDAWCSLATYSQSTGPNGITADLVAYDDDTPLRRLAGAVAVARNPRGSLHDLEHKLVQAGAKGFVTDAFSRQLSAFDADAVGRIELAPDTPLFAFSASPRRMQTFAAAARSGANAHVTVSVDRSCNLPVVAATVCGSSRDEIWIVSHLCHRGPAANDNGSGVAALLGTAAILRALQTSCGRPLRATVRFVWMPEFSGTAAYLHHRLVVEAAPAPKAVFNLDSVGGAGLDEAGPLYVERSPDHLPNVLPAFVEYCLAMDPLACGRWLSAPFLGMSDHMLFADRSIGAPCVCVGQHDDKLKHSSIDRLDRIDYGAIRFAAVAVAAAVFFVATADDNDAQEVQRIVSEWVLRQRGMSDGHGASEDYRQRCLARSLRFPDLLAPEAKAPGERLNGSGDGGGRQGDALERGWEGPFNLMTAVEQASKADREWFWAAFARDRSIYSAAAVLAFRVEGRTPRETLVRAVEERGHDAEVATRLIGLLESSGWLRRAGGRP